MRVISILSLFTILLFAFETNKEIEVTGTVVSSVDGKGLAGVEVRVKYTKITTTTNTKGEYKITAHDRSSVLVYSKPGFQKFEKLVGVNRVIDVKLVATGIVPVEEEKDILADEVAEYEMPLAKPDRSKTERRKSSKKYRTSSYNGMGAMMATGSVAREPNIMHNTEEYAPVNENIFHPALSDPLSTFSIDVDAASYSNMRRFLNNGQMPPKDAVRIEEMINYFDYDYKQPMDATPFSINTEVGTAPWNEKHQLVHIGIQGKEIPTKDLPASNLVFLLDVSGSMNAPNKLPLLKSAFRLLVDQMRPEDKVSIVVYAGAAGMVLEPTSGSNKDKIMKALNDLSAGGSTAGGAGIKLAYKLAKDNFVTNGNNRVILATDGDFNVGASSNGEMQRLIEEKRNDGIFLTVLGFGMGNYKDSKMEVLADKGNGNYAYIDNLMEAKKVLVTEFGGTMYTIAKDVKIQVEFNPAHVQAYRLVGYENRILNDEDFNDDKKDAGELGSGHTVTALYEIIPTGVESSFSPIDDLKYQQTKVSNEAKKSKELMNVKLRYKDPDGDKSKLIAQTIDKANVEFEKTSENFRWSAAVASFGMLLRDSKFKGDLSYASVIKMAEGAKGIDKEGYRIEMIKLVKSGNLLASR